MERRDGRWREEDGRELVVGQEGRGLVEEGGEGRVVEEGEEGRDGWWEEEAWKGMSGGVSASSSGSWLSSPSLLF